jgi:hypothetical protein
MFSFEVRKRKDSYPLYNGYYIINRASYNTSLPTCQQHMPYIYLSGVAVPNIFFGCAHFGYASDNPTMETSASNVNENFIIFLF